MPNFVQQGDIFVLPSICSILWNQCSALNNLILELSETLFHTPVCDIVAVQSHCFTMFWVFLHFAIYGYMCPVSETLQYYKSIFPCIRCNRGLKNFFIRSPGSKVIATFKYIFITTYEICTCKSLQLLTRASVRDKASKKSIGCTWRQEDGKAGLACRLVGDEKGRLRSCQISYLKLFIILNLYSSVSDVALEI